MPSLDGQIEPAPPGAHGFDANTVLTAQTAAAFRQMGFKFCVRYVSRSSPGAGGDLSHAEAQAILAGGLSLMAVQHVSRPGWVPSSTLGTQYGEAAATNSQAAGLPRGVNIWLDLEGVKTGVQSEDVIAYCNSWFDVVASAGYAPGLYVGSECILTGDELFWRLKTKHYWRSGSHVPDIPQRGYQLLQRITALPDVVNNIAIDRDVTVTDAFGGSALWVSPQPSGEAADRTPAGRAKVRTSATRARRRRRASDS